MKIAYLLAPVALLLSACNLSPIYAGGDASGAQTLLGAIEVAEIADKRGFLVRDQLLRKLRAQESARYRLQVVLDDRIDGFGVRGDNSILRERRTLRARYRLTDIATGKVLLDESASADAGIDVVSSEYAVVAAEETALSRLSESIASQIVQRLAVLGHQQETGAARP